MSASILYQLKKYHKAHSAENIIIPERTTQPSEYDEIIRSLVDIPPSAIGYEKHIGDLLFCLQSFERPPIVNVICPLEVAVAYHIFYNFGIQFTNEEKIDGFLFQFIKQRDANEYIKKLKKSSDLISMKLFMARILLATFSTFTQKPIDKMPVSFRKPAVSLLKCAETPKAAADLLESLTNIATIEQIITGRILYIAAWHWRNSQDYNVVNIVSQPKALPPAP